MNIPPTFSGAPLECSASAGMIDDELRITRPYPMQRAGSGNDGPTLRLIHGGESSNFGNSVTKG
jgi:hypothetical protein